ncbi:HRDC domain-containing protein [Metabacillus litoralis]|uniref:HRDC domain-containing protein n=1 Tax=Metabacillus litoralis TaxID=152268 RepID=UPI001CFEAB48|nr:HRDC domain-containing protein [Metabacillus litoralis]
MSFLKNMFKGLTDPRELKEPKMIKDFPEESELIKALTELSESNRQDIDIEKVQKHLKMFSIGQVGEKKVCYELKNSMLPLLILHDVNLVFENHAAQLDFVVITHKFILVLEVKKLYGNVQVSEKGEFFRVMTKNNKVIHKEGMYSPINQVERQVAILEKFLKSRGYINKCPIKYAVTFANDKTMLEVSSNAPDDIKTRLIRHDQIKNFIKSELELKSPVNMLDKELYQISDAIMNLHRNKTIKIEDYMLTTTHTSIPVVKESETSSKDDTSSPVNIQNMQQALTEFRLKRSKELDIKPYHIFTNKTLANLLQNKPQTLDQLLHIEGIGQKKADDFGQDILNIIQNCNNESTKDITTKSNETIQVPSDQLRSSLQELRTQLSKKLNTKPYYIFTNNTLDKILEKKPRTMKELLEIEGIGPKKAEEFGQDIIAVCKKVY